MVHKYSDPREKYIQLIDIEKCRAVFEPHLVFLCGGQVDVRLTTNHSIRNMFMNLSAAISSTDNQDFVLAENFKDWKDGYRSLSDFENDIALISSLVVIFLESEGALTEFGLFFANEQLRNKLVVVLDTQYYDCESFIKFGLLNPLEDLDERLVLAYDINHKLIESVSKDEVKDVIQAISEHCEQKDKSERFNHSNRGHIIFMVFQLIDLFLALTAKEIEVYIRQIGINISRTELNSAIYILKKFRLISSIKRSSQTFYFAFVDRTARIDLRFKNDQRRFDAQAVKIEIAKFYEEAITRDPNFRNRVKVIEKISSGGEAS